MINIPIDPVPSQQLSVVLDDKKCSINLYTKWTGVYFDLAIDGVDICKCRLVIDAVPIVRMAYKGMAGDFYMLDLEGSDDPDYTGFGTRWILVYD